MTSEGFYLNLLTHCEGWENGKINWDGGISMGVCLIKGLLVENESWVDGGIMVFD